MTKFDIGFFIDEPSVSTSRPTPSQPTITVQVMEPTIQIVEAGRTVRYRCTGKSRISQVSCLMSVFILN